MTEGRSMSRPINDDAQFKSLVKYYIDCVESEDDQNINFKFEEKGKKFFPDLVDKEEFFQLNKAEISFKKSDVGSIFDKTENVFYGYPLLIKGGKLSPLFFVELFIDKKGEYVRLTKKVSEPSLNRSVLKNRISNEEIKLLLDELKNDENIQQKISRVCKLIKTKFEPSTILSKERVASFYSFKIINKSVIFYGEPTGFTQSLLKELKELHEIASLKNLSSTSLKVVLNPNVMHEKTNAKIKPLLEVFDLNDHQESAIENSLTKPITVITGPPGTGKSQVVTNLVCNAVWNSKSVLFASKNNKAVDIVIDKLGEVINKELIVRMGSEVHRRSSVEKLDKLFREKNSINISDIKTEEIELKNLDDKLIELKSEKRSAEEKLKKLNNEIEHLQVKINSSLRSIPDKIYASYVDEVGDIDAKLLSNDIETFRKESMLEVILRFILSKILPSYYLTRKYNQFIKNYSTIPKKLILYTDTIKNKDQYKKFLQFVYGFPSELSVLIDEKKELRKKLMNMQSIEQIEKKISSVKSKRKDVSRFLIHNYWLKKIKNMKPSDENHLSRYIDASKKLSSYVQDPLLFRELSSQRKQEMERLMHILPVWVVTNLSVKNSVPMKEGLFDVLIIDEASQNDIASAIPLLYRAKSIVVIGDPKQLKHVATLKESEDKKIAGKNRVNNLFLDFSYSHNSLYDVAERTVKDQNIDPILLNEHYRSHRSIIGFSNKYFYGSELKIKTKSGQTKGMMWENVEGVTKNLANETEANRVIEILKQQKDSGEIGVVTIFKAQADLIERKIEKANLTGISVGTSHKFQGDEKDVIIFSPAISKGSEEKTMQWVEKTRNLINVAVTRAKSRFIIVGDGEKCQKINLLKNLYEYYGEYGEMRFDSGIEEILFNELEKRQIFVVPQFNVNIRGSKFYRLDFAYFVNGSKYDIEIDGSAHSQRIQNDMLRDKHLRLEGWKIRRFSAKRINDDIKDVVGEIERLA